MKKLALAAVLALALTACGDLTPPADAVTPPPAPTVAENPDVFCFGCAPGMDHWDMHDQGIHHTHPEGFGG